MTRFLTFLASLAAIGALTAGLANAQTKLVIELQFKTHIAVDFIEQDVFVEKMAGSGQIFRVNGADSNKFADAPLYTSAKAVAHDPMNSEAMGPYQKGAPLEFTLKKWLDAKGSATYVCQYGKGSLKAEFQGLVANGLYTMSYFFFPTPPLKPFTRLDLPMGARDGRESAFMANANGDAVYTATVEPCLQLTGDQLLAGLAIVLHSDGKTYGSNPGSFGDVSHIQLFTVFPKG